MNIQRFIENNGIMQADAIIVKKEKLGLFDHYVIFLGYSKSTGAPTFIANYGDGVGILPTSELLSFLQTYKPVAIQRFRGTSQERQYAIQRALVDLRTRSTNAYNLIKNNCQHFANWVQRGVRESEQVQNAGKITAVGGLGLAVAGLASKNEKLLVGGLLLTVLGGITASLGDD